MICQVAGTDTDLLTCDYEDSLGYRCEIIAPHGDNEHSFGKHTINHSLAGNGYTCEAIEDRRW